MYSSIRTRMYKSEVEQLGSSQLVFFPYLQMVIHSLYSRVHFQRLRLDSNHILHGTRYLLILYYNIYIYIYMLYMLLASFVCLAVTWNPSATTP